MNSKMTPSNRAGAGPVAAHERMLAPDLGRGFMLLLIVVAHAPMYLFTADSFLITRPPGDHWLDDVVNFIGLLFVDNRAYPMFAVLFGYGLAAMVKRQLAAGEPKERVKRLLRRRSWFLVLFGAVHCIVIGGADVLGLYGISALLAGSLLFRSDRAKGRAILWVSLAYLVLMPLVWVAVMPISSGDVSFAHLTASHTYFQVVMENLIAYPIVIAAQMLLFPMVLPILVGIWLAGKNWLERPEQHRSLLKRIAIGGILISMLGALPLALTGARLWNPAPMLLDWGVVLALLSGLAGGFGYTALIALASLSARNSAPKLTNWLAAVGKRSLTFYLYQEAMLVILLSPVALGFGGIFSGAGIFAASVLIWAVGVVLASWMEKRGMRGPADALLRKLVYRL
ncbi:MAG: hypothetical protein K0R28_417 [Paenibacillus sp.]|nr:hypothetical protein [Paenibacillus sp.]